MSRPSKKLSYLKVDFSDEEVYDEIKDDIRDIKDRNLKNLEEAELINELYQRHRQEKKKRKMLKEKDTSKSHVFHSLPFNSKNSSQDDEQGQINEKRPIKSDSNAFSDFHFEGVPSISNLGDHIRPLTLTRNRIVDLLNSRRFQELVKGCFVRYHIESGANSNSNSYIIAQIVGVTQGSKEYTVNNVKTKVLLKLQQTSQNVVTFAIQLISNQHPPGGLQIEKWLETNRNKIPKQKQLKEKLEEHNKLLVEQLSSTQIDSNIWKKAKKIAEHTEQPKQDPTRLIDFVSDRLHNLEIQIDQQSIGRKTTKGDIDNLIKQRDQASKILEQLKIVREKYIQNQPVQKKNEASKKEKKYSWSMAEQKRKDAINEKCKARYIMLATYDGCNKLRNQILEAHSKYNFELE